MDASSLNESFENSENVVNIKIQGSESNSVKHFKLLKVGQSVPVYNTYFAAMVKCKLWIYRLVASFSSCFIKSVSVSLILLHQVC